MTHYSIPDYACPNLIGFRYKFSYPSSHWIRVNRSNCIGSDDFLQDYMSIKRLKSNNPDSIRLYAIYLNGKECLVK